MKLTALLPASLLGALLASVVIAPPALAEPDCTKKPTPRRCLPDWQPPHAGQVATYRLQPEVLEVFETEDWGADEAYIAFSASHRWGPVTVNNGDRVDLSHLKDWRFVNTSQSLSLFDLDGGEWLLDADDQLGSMVVWTSDADGRLRSHDFTEDGARYRLHYRVFFEGCVGQSCPTTSP